MPRTSVTGSSVTLQDQSPFGTSPFLGLPSPTRRSAGGVSTFAERFRHGIGDYAYKFAEQMEEELRMLYASQMMEATMHVASHRSQSGHTSQGDGYNPALFLRGASARDLAGGATSSEAIMGCTPLDLRHSQMDPLSLPELQRVASPLHRVQSRFDKDSPTNRVNTSPTRDTQANSMSTSFVPTLREDLLQVLQDNWAMSLGQPGKFAQQGNVALQFGNNRDLELNSRFVMRLDSPIRLVFEFISVVALFHDITVVPYILAFDADTEGSTLINTALLISLGVWTLDIFMNFFTGFVRSDGEVEMSLPKIATKYVRTWFTIDCAIVLSDWTSNILDWTSQTDIEALKTMRLIRVARVSRLFRIMTLVRLLKMSPLLSRMNSSAFSSTSMSVVFQALQILFVIVWINHISSCVWFALGRAANENFFESDTEQTWLYQQVGSSGKNYAEIGKLFQYTTSMHWSLTQMTPGSMSVVPRNSFERIWNIICLIFGLLFGTSLVGQLSSKMVQFNMNRQVELKRMETLRRFLRENYIRPGLATRIQEQIAERMAVKTRLSEADVEDIKHLSNQLRQQLRQETFMPHIVQHPIFSAWGYFDGRIAKALCASGGITFTCVPPAHELFTINSSDDKAHLSLKGSMVYAYHDDSGELFSSGQGGSSGLNPGTGTVRSEVAAHGSQNSMAEGKEKLVKYDLDKGAWVGEVSLWMVWRHLGSLEAVTPCEYMTVTSQTLVEVLQSHVHVVELTFAWCRVMYMQTQGEGLHILRHMEVGQNFASVVMEMPDHLRTIIGRCALHMLESHLWRRRAAGELEKEVESGKCVLVLDGSGECIRTVPVVALKILRHSDRKMLSQVAKFTGQSDSGSWEPSCKLPGKKCEIRTEALEAAQQLLQEAELIPFANRVTLGTSFRTLETKDSATYGVKSQYVRTIYFATYGENFPRNGEENGDGESHGENHGEHPSPTEPRQPEVPSRFVEFGGLTVETMALRDKKGNWLMYCWLSDDEFKTIEEAHVDEDIKALEFNQVVIQEDVERPSLTASEGDNKDKSSALASTSAFTWLAEQAHKLQKNAPGSRRPSKTSQVAGMSKSVDEFLRSDVTHDHHSSRTPRASGSSSMSGTRASGSSQLSVPRDSLTRNSQVLPVPLHAPGVQIPRDSVAALPRDSVVELSGITERDDDKSLAGSSAAFDYEMDL